MDGFDELSQLIDNDLGLLKDVFEVRSKLKISAENLLDGSDLELLILSFENRNIVLKAIGVDDTIAIALRAAPKAIATEIPSEFARFSKKSLANLEPWKNAIDKFLFCAWSLTNDRGYSDAIQFEFGLDGGKNKIRLQLEVMCSHFYSFSVIQNLKN
jgi:hypothetical protein